MGYPDPLQAPPPPQVPPPHLSPRTDAAELLAERSLPELLGDLTRDLSHLLRQEVELAKAEIREEAGRAGQAGARLGGAALAGYMALILLSFALAWGLAALLPTGAAFLVVGLLYAVPAGALYVSGRKHLKEIRPLPEQTVETVKEDAQWARDRMR
jgi:hypothetical protein